MSQSIIDEVMFLLHSMVMGAVITFVYDGFLILRRIVRHSRLLISLEDMVFWIGCAIGVFFMLYEENNGILRWFAVFGAGIGMVLYKKSISSLIIEGVSGIFSFIFRILSRIFKFVLKPVSFLIKKAQKRGRGMNTKLSEIRKYLRNKLTEYKKVLKMILCKH